MKTSTFNLIDAINREGLDNSQWGIIEDIESTKDYFCNIEPDEQLKGQWIYVYVDENTTFSFMRDTLKDVKRRYRVDNNYILLWKV